MLSDISPDKLPNINICFPCNLEDLSRLITRIDQIHWPDLYWRRIIRPDGSSVDKDHPSSINTGRTRRRTIGVSSDSSRIYSGRVFRTNFRESTTKRLGLDCSKTSSRQVSQAARHIGFFPLLAQAQGISFLCLSIHVLFSTFWACTNHHLTCPPS